MGSWYVVVEVSGGVAEVTDKLPLSIRTEIIDHDNGLFDQDRINIIKAWNDVVVEVSGGVAEVTHRVGDISVKLIDHDNKKESYQPAKINQ